ncbi:Heterokaryon incompatibility protein 6, OR allele [Fulvia fulva]|uniref:Heterokaryon incompatibility protein 6, OR allele n=1 Tax=Passalora fulva TaxID=5499 RepID=A0A9Q8UUL0_PASFU|nr:Heterokaryon incompatibility protein 6, OR allele [Fulvia fulva]KAK4626751.1 Heterokaryon incompatibility protein 6, OR allele [Fulvia fulva]KAK4628092.1 Heterokaryon incompatibility protein 6, OR allele [Fulvia fulva]UJO23051.1 Heterokaryon incompatibility protein 6, OR allele [Fulvia fulva]WPV13533.1 Heterokaryon incompatibility protein 6, OR allele [Fulvia fulva]WPV28751.1 Heterokaryon incompatibility protein 6, OR allele [Fulvia fulva]
MSGSAQHTAFSHGPDNVSYKYKPLHEEDIRIVKFDTEASRDDLRLLSEHRPRGMEIPYYALSYCWGDARVQKRITLDDQSFMVTSSLLEALTALSAWLGPKHAYWIDAICINQHDINERNSQVQQMWRIFSGAVRVVSWLGPDDHDTKALFDAWTKAGNETTEVDEAIVERGIGAILSRPYFTRTWVIPEIMQARKIVLACGSSYFPQRAMQAWLSMTSSALRNRHELLLCSHLRRFSDLPKIALSSPFQLNVVITAYESSSCSDPRDRVFAMLSDPGTVALRPALWLKADYSLTVEELWLEVMRQHTALNLHHAWDQLANDVSGFGSCLADALGVRVRSEPFGRWLAQQIGIAWQPDDCSSHVAVLKAGGVIMIGRALHPII